MLGGPRFLSPRGEAAQKYSYNPMAEKKITPMSESPPDGDPEPNPDFRGGRG